MPLFCCSLDFVETFKVQVSNDTIKWKPCKNGTEEAVCWSVYYSSFVCVLVEILHDQIHLTWTSPHGFQMTGKLQ